MSITQRTLIPLTILTASLLYYLSYASYGFSEEDWGGIIVAADRFLKGDVFYRDFNIVYTPGLYLYTALAFKISNISLSTAAAAWSVLRALNCVLIYVLGSRFFSWKIALALPLVLWLAPGPLHKSFLVSLELISILSLVSIIQGQNRGTYFFAGLTAGILLLFRIDLFAVFILLSAVSIIIKQFQYKMDLNISSWLMNCILFLSAFSILIIPFIYYLFYHDALADAITMLRNYSSSVQIKWVQLPSVLNIASWTIWGYINYLVILIPAGVYFTFLVQLPSALRKTRDSTLACMGIITLYGLLLMPQILRAPWTGRLYQVLPPMLIIAFYLMLNSREMLKCRPFLTMLPIISSTALALIIIASCTTSDIYMNNSIFIRLTNTTRLIAPGVNTYTTPSIAGEFNRVREIIESETAPGEPIFTVHHLPMYYFATGRVNATRHYFLESYAASIESQKEIIEDLQRKQVKLVIVSTNYLYADIESAPLVMEYLTEHFSEQETVGNKIILIRKTGLSQ
ncbi:MAG: hypothetical protein ISR96_07130 [Nitrospira sp.]|nr:hypothetical protein [bacterium]MBL7049268.1 hypothetical protein [Nitrospira sp.]